MERKLEQLKPPRMESPTEFLSAQTMGLMKEQQKELPLVQK
jgi:hypothetical protein